jgi:GT2 family glycosyltransferase
MDRDYDVDVIILSLNRIKETLEAVDSACAQTGLSVAIHIVDQASAVENLARLTAHVEGRPDITLISLKTNIGVPGGRNIAARSGRAPFIVALDNDAEFATPQTVLQAVETLRGDPQLGAIGFRIVNYATDADDETSWGYPVLDWERRHLEFPATNFVGAGHALRRQAFEEAGGYDERLFFIGEELELGLKMLNLGYRIRYVGSIVVRHKVTGEERIGWQEGRYFFTARNRIYLALKSGMGPGRLLQIAGGMALGGLRRRRPIEVLRALAAGVVLYAALPVALRTQSVSRLKPETAALADTLNQRHRYGLWERMRNAWRAGAEDPRSPPQSLR